MGKKVLVTGGAGYIGSHACKSLWQNGHEVVVFDNLENGFRHNVKWGELVEGDLRDFNQIREAMKMVKPHAVMHFAAYAYVGESVKEPIKYYENNVTGSINLLRAMSLNKVKQLVFSSSCATYGTPSTTPITEDMIQNPINPYGRTKLMMERLMHDWSYSENSNYCSLRYFNAAGADPEGEIGEEHEPETHLIPLIFRAIDGKIPGLTVYGNDYETSDGTCVRDYIHVFDLARAHLLALEFLDTTRKSVALNLGNGSGYSVKQVIETVERVTGKKVPHSYGKRRPGDPPELIGAAKLAEKLLSWKPKFPKLEDIVQHAWEFYRMENKKNKD